VATNDELENMLENNNEVAVFVDNVSLQEMNVETLT
jgi:hypothetical protein